MGSRFQVAFQVVGFEVQGNRVILNGCRIEVKRAIVDMNTLLIEERHYGGDLVMGILRSGLCIIH